MNNTLFYGGPIITMAEPLYAQALLIRRGKIVYCGELEQAQALADEQTLRVDLQGCALAPAFIDCHSHLSQVADSLHYVSLAGADSIEEIGRRIQAWIAENKPEPGRWVVGSGYDHNDLPGGLHPTARQLDELAPDHPLLITHASGHMGAANARGLRELGISSSTPDPAGGRIGRDEQGCLTGYLEENALAQRIRQIPRPTQQQRMENLARAQKIYLRQGVTTCQDGKTNKADFEFLCAAAKNGALELDTVAYADLKNAEDLLDQYPQYRSYQRNLKIGGYKIFLDGSPQGRTAWMTKPYLGGKEGYKGYPIYTDDAVREFCQKALESGDQLLAHCNGDAAAQQFIDAFEKAQGCCRVKNQIRPVMIHAQTVRPDQLERMAQLDMMASFFVAHAYYWGDVHRKNFGDERAMAISPARTALEKGVRFTFHQDAPVVPPEMWRTVWCAVNRLSKTGAVVGEGERISTLEAMKALTVNAAYQYFEEESKGTLEEGKLADLMILDRDPLETPPMELKDIQTLATIKEGSLLWKKDDPEKA